MNRRIPHFIISSALATLLAATAHAAGTATFADCVRDDGLDVWAAQDSAFCRNVMAEVFKNAGIEATRLPFGPDGMCPSNAEVICSAFRTPRLLKNYDFPVQPLGRMHFALYTTADRALTMMSTSISKWPHLRVAYSPVSQGCDRDRENYFERARLSPTYVEFPTSAAAVDSLRTNAADALFLYTPLGKRPEGLVEIVPMGERNVYFAVRKDRPELFRALEKSYRDFYIDHIDRIDAWRAELLGIPKPVRRVRLAAYSRGDFFSVTPDGVRSGALETWMRTLCGHTHWSVDYVYGNYDQCVEDVRSGRLDLLGGVGFTANRRDLFLYPHTPIGMLRVYLWAHRDSPYQEGDPSTWAGMKVGLLGGTVSSERAKRQFQSETQGVTCVEYATDRDLIQAFKNGEVDALVDVEMPDLDGARALHLFASHPMYICATPSRRDLFDELERALEDICDDFPKYMRMISEHHYGVRSELSALTLVETEWLAERQKDPKPVSIDFSPWPFTIVDHDTKQLTGFVRLFVNELERKTGLPFQVQPQVGLLTAESRFLRGESDLWVPFPETGGDAVYGATSLLSIPVAQSFLRLIGVEDVSKEFELFARPGLPEELVSILRKVLSGIDTAQLQEMFMSAAAERQIVHRVFGRTRAELSRLILEIAVLVLGSILAFAVFMAFLLRREARRASRAAELSEQHAAAKTRFLAMMSHELRTPLNAVIGFAEFLAKEKYDERRRREYISGIILSSNALLELINDILDLSKLDAGAMDMRTGVCDVNRLLREIPAIFGYRVRRHGVKLVIQTPPQPIPILRLSQQGLRQILINLIGNSAKFTEVGQIAVKVDWIGETGETGETGTLVFDITDTGCGISQQKLDRLFDPFVQDIASRMYENAGEMKGTGLGLPIVKRMVDGAQGVIDVKSKLGEGTNFHIEIPGLAIVPGEKPSTPDDDHVMQIIPNRVLVVDDMVVNRKVLGIHLGNLGVEDVRYGENGQQALEVMEDWVPDLVLTDMWMPVMDGSQLAEAMNHDRRLAEIPIVAITADVDVGSTYDMKLFKKILSKPVNNDKLRALFGEL